MSRPPNRATAGPPDHASLHEAALAHLARYAATEAQLRAVLQRRVARWARTAAGEREAIAAATATARQAAADIAARLAAAGAVNDATYAASRARNLARAGRSRRAIAAHLAARGVAEATLRDALPAPADELLAALVLARRRRIGPFRPAPHADDPTERREMGMLARAGFSRDVATQALGMDHTEAEQLVLQLRQS